MVFKNGNVYTKNYEKNNSGPRSLLVEDRFGRTRTGKTELAKLLEISILFENPKSSKLLKFLLSIGSNTDSLILDFFAGSGTTADAVMQLNAEDGGNRRFMMVQLPEQISQNSTAYKAGYKSIDEISRARIEKAAEKIKNEKPLESERLDLGFKHYRVIKPNQQTIDEIVDFSDADINLFKDMISPFSSESLNIKGQSSGQDTIFTTWLTIDGYKFDTEIVEKDFAGISVPYIDNSRIYIINENWNFENTKALVNEIGTNNLNVQTIVVYAYSMTLEAMRELEIAVEQLNSKVNIVRRY